MALELVQRQTQQLSQAQIQSLEILTMDATELSQFIKNEYTENPLIEYDEKNKERNEDTLTSISFDSFTITPGPRNVTDDDDDFQREFKAPSPDDLTDYLVMQLDLPHLSSEELALYRYLIGCLDDNGFFTMDPLEVSEKTGASTRDIRHALKVLKTLEPDGVFTANMEECLILQLEHRHMNTPDLENMIRNHLQDIADGRISPIAKELHLTPIEVRKNIEIIRSLNPKPLSGFGTEQPGYIIPDIIFKKENDAWVISQNDNGISGYGLNDYYIRMMKETGDAELSSYFREKLNRARFVMNSIEQRKKTLMTISRIVLEKQIDYFENRGSLRPMTMTDVAEEAEIHISTVGRAIKGKYLQYPGGCMPLRKLFTVSASTDRNTSVTPVYVKQKISEYIRNENKKKPLSDKKIVDMLSAEGITISRRAVTKYREEMNIRSSFDRKEIG